MSSLTSILSTSILDSITTERLQTIAEYTRERHTWTTFRRACDAYVAATSEFSGADLAWFRRPISA